MVQYTRLTGSNDGSLTTTLCSLAKCSPRILNDWMRDSISIPDAQNIHEVLDASFGHTAILIATYVPIPKWHQRIPDPTTGWCTTFILLN
jgi:hypothetical protein